MTMRSSMTAIKRKLSTLANRCSRGTAQEKGSQRLTLAPDQKSGEGGIRTPGTVSGTQQFQCCTIGHSVTSPDFQPLNSLTPLAPTWKVRATVTTGFEVRDVES